MPPRRRGTKCLRRGGNPVPVPAATASEPSSIGHTLYDGAADFGRFMSLLSMIGSTVAGVALLAFGIYMLYRPEKRTASGPMKATSATCRLNKGNIECAVIGTLNAPDGKQYTITVNTSGVAVQKDQILIVNFDPSNPIDASYGTQISNSLIGWICIGAGLFILIGGIIWYWITTRYKFAAAAQGVASGADLFTGNSGSYGSSGSSGSGPSSGDWNMNSGEMSYSF